MSISTCQVCMSVPRSGQDVICSRCAYIGCAPCYQRSLTETSVHANAPRMLCINCRETLIMATNIYRPLLTTFVNIRAQKVLDNERAKLGDSVRAYDLRNMIESAANDMTHLRERRQMMPTPNVSHATTVCSNWRRALPWVVREELYEHHSRAIAERMRIISIELRYIEQRHAYPDRVIATGPATTISRQAKRARITSSCCGNSACTGYGKSYVDSDTCECSICHERTCTTCTTMISSGVEHTCPADMLESIQAIRADSMQCPMCGTSISKVEGCNDMYCTLCKTPFSYRTGEIIVKEFHNPHAAEEQNALRNDAQRWVVSVARDSYQRIAQRLTSIYLDTIRAATHASLFVIMCRDLLVRISGFISHRLNTTDAREQRLGETRRWIVHMMRTTNSAPDYAVWLKRLVSIEMHFTKIGMLCDHLQYLVVRIHAMIESADFDQTTSRAAFNAIVHSTNIAMSRTASRLALQRAPFIDVDTVYLTMVSIPRNKPDQSKQLDAATH